MTARNYDGRGAGQAVAAQPERRVEAPVPRAEEAVVEADSRAIGG